MLYRLESGKEVGMLPERGKLGGISIPSTGLTLISVQNEQLGFE